MNINQGKYEVIKLFNKVRKQNALKGFKYHCILNPLRRFSGIDNRYIKVSMFILNKNTRNHCIPIPNFKEITIPWKWYIDKNSITGGISEFDRLTNFYNSISYYYGLKNNKKIRTEIELTWYLPIDNEEKFYRELNNLRQGLEFEYHSLDLDGFKVYDEKDLDREVNESLITREEWDNIENPFYLALEKNKGLEDKEQVSLLYNKPEENIDIFSIVFKNDYEYLEETTTVCNTIDSKEKIKP